MVGAQGASAELIGEREGVYGPRSPDAHELAQRETELALGWLESEMHAAGIDSFKDAEHARAFIEQRLRDRLHASYGLEPASAM
jgi:hypothetical protein